MTSYYARFATKAKPVSLSAATLSPGTWEYGVHRVPHPAGEALPPDRKRLALTLCHEDAAQTALPKEAGVYLLPRGVPDASLWHAARKNLRG